MKCLHGNHRRCGEDHPRTGRRIKHPPRHVHPSLSIPDSVPNTNEWLATVMNDVISMNRLTEPGMKSVANHHLGIPHIVRWRCTTSNAFIHRWATLRPANLRSNQPQVRSLRNKRLARPRNPTHLRLLAKTEGYDVSFFKGKT